MFDDSFKSKNSLKEILTVVFFPIIFLATILFGFIDRYFFAGRFEKQFSDKVQAQFTCEIQERVGCLFRDFGAQIVPNIEPTPLAFDYAMVTLQVDAMLLRFIRGRMDFQVDLAPIDKPGAWKEISNVVKNSDCAQKEDRKLEYSGLNDFGQFFQLNFDLLRHEVSKLDWGGSAGWLRPIT